MRLNVNPNRMELMKLRNRLAMARRGHKLLKDKLDALVQDFIRIVRENANLRREVEREVVKAFEAQNVASLMLSETDKDLVTLASQQKLLLDVRTRYLTGVRVPRFEVKIEGDPYSYGVVHTPAELDAAFRSFSRVLPLMIRLAEAEKTIELLAVEIEKTRRRVNALEYVLIPNLEETIKYIQLKLEELARSAITGIMRIKGSMR
ncbi:MAG: V-type ATP synthase subunit D [Candidatus Caldatribacterium sp.]|uniref:V-type ATP synthase subunit D n=1 Tax=Candidatus Caldatribacterium sp. TaxID=2282143 RepID=UPI00299425C0|nr:V-type ATP synthase subunit D [Candidatus Caldatribacterium sp.]MCX7729587.1 V-type ATP synthase subunit D [Candidatus Caldatribacterium sp.]MDW8081371.1 V-type ATP synthase subunit D [Candidatus Calescibacterium sp.]